VDESRSYGERPGRRADLPEVRPDGHRHIQASVLIDLDAQVKAISEHMDHSETGVTMTAHGASS
jgi:hypothetical protein